MLSILPLFRFSHATERVWNSQIQQTIVTNTNKAFHSLEDKIKSLKSAEAKVTIQVTTKPNGVIHVFLLTKISLP